MLDIIREELAKDEQEWWVESRKLIRSAAKYYIIGAVGQCHSDGYTAFDICWNSKLVQLLNLCASIITVEPILSQKTRGCKAVFTESVTYEQELISLLTTMLRTTGCRRNIRGSRRARGLHSDIEACAVMVAWVCSNNQLHPWKRLVNLSVDDGKMLIFILLQTVPGRYFGPSWWCLQAFFYTSGVPTGCHGTCSLKHLLTSRDSHISYYLCLSGLLAGSIKRHPTTFPCHLYHGRYWWTLALHIAMSNTSWCERILSQTAFFKLSCSVDSFQVRARQS